VQARVFMMRTGRAFARAPVSRRAGSRGAVMSIPNTPTCREAVRLMLLDEEHDIAATERLAFQVHARIRNRRARFVDLLNFMRRATKAWRKHSETFVDQSPAA
jgi:hypothetical protein